ncbi:hypothetical protein [Nocardia asteroides]|uniref:hypothetical protein n=1 Tax=Nocardia asteroides TaxID=1824 RepID=UPI0033FDBD1D
MHEMSWLNKDHHFEPGAELFRSERIFAVWSYTVSHGQLLLRSQLRLDDGHLDTIDILFKPVKAMKLQSRYEGLVIRCASAREAAAAKAEMRQPWPEDRVLVMESDGIVDYVVSLAVGWCEGVLPPGQRGWFVDDPSRPPPRFVDGVDSGLSI